MWYLSFAAGLISLSIILSSSIHAAGYYYLYLREREAVLQKEEQGARATEAL